MLGRTIGKYRVVEQIGRGGMGTVYKAIDETLDRTVAIKVLNGDVLEQESIERFRREAMTLAKLNHPRIGAIHELTRDGHDLLMVMEFLEGETCERLIEKSGATPLSIGRAVQICSQALEALQYAHSAGIVHRDLKPANIIIAPNGDVKLMDFGIARVQGSEHLTSHGFMVGTPAYMSPEQVRGEEVDPRMDLYAIAVVLYRLLTNHLPFAGDTAIAMIHSQLANQPTPAQQFRSDLPDWVTGVLTRGLAKIANDRFQTAAEFRSALEAGLTGKMAVFAAPAVDDMDVTRGPMLTPPAMPVPQPMPAMSGSGREMIPSGILAMPPQPHVPPAPTNQAPVQAPSPKAAPTVTLRAPHIAGAAVLVVLLVIGVTVLAMIAFRRSSTSVAPASTTADAPAPSATPAAAETTTPAAPVATTPPAVTPAESSSPSATPAVTTPSTPGPATTATATGRGAAPPAATTGSATVTAPRPGEATAGRGDSAAGRRGGAPATTPPAPAAASSTATPATPAAPAAADAPTENFGTVRAFMPDGTKSKEVESLLSLEPGTLIVRNRGDGSVLRSLSYRQVAAATYTRGRRPRAQSISGAVNVPENFAGGGVFGTSRHWLILQTSSEFLVLRLEDRNVIGVLKSIEARTGLKVQRDQDN